MKPWLLFGAAVLSLLITTSKAAITNNLRHTVHIINGLPKNSTEAMEISCKSKSMSPKLQGLGAGETYNWRVKKREVHECYATWRNHFQIWNAFQPRRDQLRTNVYWLVKEDGFYLSWDHLNWVRKALWESE